MKWIDNPAHRPRSTKRSRALRDDPRKWWAWNAFLAVVLVVLVVTGGVVQGAAFVAVWASALLIGGRSARK